MSDARRRITGPRTVRPGDEPDLVRVAVADLEGDDAGA